MRRGFGQGLTGWEGEDAQEETTDTEAHTAGLSSRSLEAETHLLAPVTTAMIRFESSSSTRDTSVVDERVETILSAASSVPCPPLCLWPPIDLLSRVRYAYVYMDCDLIDAG